MVNNALMQFLGILIIINTMAVSFWLLSATSTNRWGLGLICGLGIAAGILVMISHRITGLKIPKIGEVQAAIEQATIDAKAISNIKARVEGQSATIDLIASSANDAKRLAEDASLAYSQVKNEVAELGTTTKKAGKIIEEMSDLQELTLTIQSAFGGDRRAFDRLENYRSEDRPSFEKLASSAWQEIQRRYSGPPLRPYVGNYPEEEKTALDKLDFKQLRVKYQSLERHERQNFLAYVWNREDIPRIDKLDFMVDVVENDGSLWAAQDAAQKVRYATDPPIHGFDPKALTKWWRENRDRFVDG